MVLPWREPADLLSHAPMDSANAALVAHKRSLCTAVFSEVQETRTDFQGSFLIQICPLFIFLIVLPEHGKCI